MKATEIEQWALKLCEQVIKKKNSVEDSRVELKSQLPTDKLKVARRIAAHANAAREDYILWIIGLDENAHTSSSIKHEDLANWWPAVEKHFDELSPSLTDVKFTYDGHQLLALCFETTRPPYVFKNGDKTEIPWRSGTRTRSAKRSEMLLTLSNKVKMPKVRLAPPNIFLLGGRSAGTVKIVLEANVYFIHNPRELNCVFPLFDYHGCLKSSDIFAEKSEMNFKPKQESAFYNFPINQQQEFARIAPISQLGSELNVRDSGLTTLRMTFENINFSLLKKATDLTFHVRLLEALSENHIEWHWQMKVHVAENDQVEFKEA